MTVLDNCRIPHSSYKESMHNYCLILAVLTAYVPHNLYLGLCTAGLER